MPKTTKKTMQAQLFRKALHEINVSPKNIAVDHRLGTNTVNDVKMGIIYPLYFLKRIETLSTEKIYHYAFQGNMTFGLADLNRKELLEKYDTQGNKIISTDYGIKRKDKTEFDESYFQLLSNSYFALTPNWGGYRWDHDDAWTYRFIEAALCKSIPIVFRETPLSKKFTDGITFYFNDETHTLTDYNDIVNENFNVAKKKWFIQNDQIKRILGSR